MTASQFNRRRFLKASAAASAAAAVAPYIQTSHAAGSLSVGFWDHWVPGANAVLTRLCTEWSKKEKVDLKIDYLPDQGGKLVLTGFSEAQAKSGHDILAFPTWFASAQAGNLEPVDDIMETLIANNGNVLPAVEYVGKQSGHWIGVPATPGSQMTTPCARIDLFRQYVGLDITKMYPPEAPPDKTLTDQWTWATFLAAAEKCFNAGYPFGLGLGQTGDSVDWVSALFASYGAELVDANGNVTVNSDATKQALEYMKQLVPLLPRDVFTWDDASNNKWLIAGKGALIMNPPSAWAVAKRDNPKLAGQLWTFPSPRGPKGRYQASAAQLLGHLEVFQQQTGCEEPAQTSLSTFSGGTVGRGERWLRHPKLFGLCRISRSGQKKGRPKEPSTTTRRRPIRPFGSRPHLRHPRSLPRSTRRPRLRR